MLMSVVNSVIALIVIINIVVIIIDEEFNNDYGCAHNYHPAEVIR